MAFTEVLMVYLSIITGSYNLSEISNGPDGFSNQILSAIVAFVMGIIALLRSSRGIPRKVVDAGKVPLAQMRQSDEATVPAAAFNCMLQRLGDLEEKMSILNKKPEMPTERKEILNAAVKRVDALESELAVTKKVKVMKFLLARR